MEHDIASPLLGTVLDVRVTSGEQVARGQDLLVIESMKMEHPIEAPCAGIILGVLVRPGDTVSNGQTILRIAETDAVTSTRQEAPVTPTAERRQDLIEVRRRRALVSDANRPDAVSRRAAKGQRTARENIEDLLDAGSFVEYGTFAIAAQRKRRSVDDLISNTPADGLVGGIGTVNAEDFPGDPSRVVVASYDYTVLAGTQGFINHRKKDRLFAIAAQLRLPVVMFAEGGGGRPGDTDAPGVAQLDCMAFALFAELSGLVPLIGIASGYCFAGNAALLGMCDVVIATDNANIGMAGPAMIEGGGLGSVAPTDIGPIEVQTHNGVVDVRVKDEAEAVTATSKYLSYFQGPLPRWDRHDDADLRDVVPVQRTRVYDVHRAVELLADKGTVMELRPSFGLGILTALVRIEGRSVGVIANNPAHLGGAIDSDAADKCARFVQLCDAYDIPIVSLCDTPGFMVGPEAERTAQVRHFSRMFVTAASTTVPWVTIVLRKGYGLGAQAMARGSFHANTMTLAWPTGEFGGMGLEGAVRLGFRKELDEQPDPTKRAELEAFLIQRAYENGSALNVASHFEIDDVIDPADTRRHVLALIGESSNWRSRASKKRPMIDTW